MVIQDNKYRKNIGRLGEELALKHLQNNGFSLVAKNVLAWGGELDLVMQKNGLFHLVEVKTSRSLVNPLEHINLKKLKDVKRLGEHYLRFDLKTQDPFVLTVCAVWLNKDETLKKIEVLENVEL